MKQITVPNGATILITQPDDADMIEEALKNLLAFNHCGDKRIFNSKNPFYQKGDENAPFFTEAYLYSLFEDKDAARTLLGRIRGLINALGYEQKTFNP